MSNVFGIQYLVPTGRNKEYTKSVVYGATANFIANFMLIPKFGGVGAALGSVIAETIVTLTQYLYVHKDLKINWDLSYVKYLVAAALMYPAVAFIGTKMGPSILTNVLQAGVGSLIYGLVLILTKEEMIMKVINKFLRRQNG